LHAPEVVCIGRGKARAPYEFGCKVSIVTPVTAPKGGQFVLRAKALHGNPYDGHTLGPVIADLETLTGVAVRGIHGDKGYRGHNHPNRFKVWITGQVRRITKAVRREMRRRAAVEPVIGHVKEDHRMGRNYPRAATATASTRFSPPPATTSACSCAGSGAYCAPCC
jgi:transposase, IS5 family